MKHVTLIAAFLMSSVSAFAGQFECQTFHNLDVVSSQVVTTTLNQRQTVDETDLTRSFLKETANEAFSLEVYLVQHDMRIYSEATVNKTNMTIAASVWARDAIIEVVCRQLN
jgi:hypothetical protein